MILTKTTISLLCALVLISIFMANLLNSLATDHNFYIEDKLNGLNYTKYLEGKYGPIADSSEKIIWFLQISDLHISIFRDSGRISQFQQFCDSTVRRIKPMLVLATGDLTDAKTKDNLGSTQVKSEWVYYHNIIAESGVTKETTWLDIRGNHDNFNINNINSQENYFRNYSVQGGIFMRSYLHLEKSNGVNVAFLAVDACPDPGIKRPFNFIGIIDGHEQQNIKKLSLEAQAKADHIVWFAHYPTSCILSLEKDSKAEDMRGLIGGIQSSQVFLCGHLHSMGGLVPKMYTKQKKGFLELELGDWKDNRMYRLAAIDHGIFSFVDQRHNTWPLILVTNPKHAQYALSGREPLDLIASSTFVRILAFSDVDIDIVRISFDKNNWKVCRNVKGPLYVCPWTSGLYKTGINYLYVEVTDELGKEAFVEHPFSLDGSIMSFDIKARILLMLNARVVFQAAFGTLFMVSVLPLIFLRLQKRPPRFGTKFSRRALRRVWLLSKIDRIFYPYILYSIYLPFGPWAVGRLIDGYTGVIFAWGIIIRGAFIPEPFTYVYGSVQYVFVHLPLVVVLAYSLDHRIFSNQMRGMKRIVKHFPFVFLLSIQLLLAYFFWLEYGTMSFFFGPLRTWSIILSTLLWYKVMTLHPDYCRKLQTLDDLQS